jgi:hypothetical protein
MRHSTIDLTMNVYTDPRLLDVAGAVEALPSLPLDGGSHPERIAAKATGTNDSRASELAPTLAPTPDKPRVLQSISTLLSNQRPADAVPEALAVSACPVKRKDPLTTAVNGSSEWAAPGSNWRPLPCECAGSPSEGVTNQEVASTPSDACTAACTSEAENANAGTAETASLGTPPDAAGPLDTDQGSKGEGAADKPADPLAGLAAAIANLTPADRARLGAMLTPGKEL